MQVYPACTLCGAKGSTQESVILTLLVMVMKVHKLTFQFHHQKKKEFY